MRKKKPFKIILIILVLLFAFIFFFVRPYYIFAQKVLGVSPLRVLLTSGNFKKIDNKVNILLLGKAGGQHDGPNLTDSITVISFNLNKKTITFISIPRDIWSPTLRDRVNSAYAYGEAIKEGGGLTLSKAEVSAIVGIPIPYSAVIDFEKFKELIDFLGGVDIDVDRAFDDYKFPIPGREDDLCGQDKDKIASDAAEYKCRYEHLSFKKGKIHMDGTVALKFVRSRHAEGEEGSDYARGKRQQKVISAIYEKMLKKIKSFNLADLEKMYKLVNSLISRDIKNSDAVYIAKKIFLEKNIKTRQVALTNDFFEVPDSSNYDGKYVLIPPDNDFTVVHKFVECNIEGKNNCKEPTK